MTTSFVNGPKIAVHIEIFQGAISSSRLTLSDVFTCTGADSSLLEWLELYSKGKPIPLALPNGTPFQRDVWFHMQKIPFGKTMSYGQLALASSHPKAARAVGNACNRNPFPLLVPCHRVIQSNGKIGGFAVDLEIKRRLIEFEAGLSPAP